MAHPLFDLYFGASSEDDGDRGARFPRRGAEASPTPVRGHPSDATLSASDERTLDERMLSDGIRAGDSGALDACVRRYGERLVRVAELTTGSRDTAWDVAQDVFIELWRTRARIDPSRRLVGYLLRATRHRALDAVRRTRSQARLAQAVTTESRDQLAVNLGDVAIDSAEFRERVHEVLRALPPRCREIFLLHREAGLSYEEIETLLGVSNATIRNQVSRATRHLAHALDAGAFDDWAT